MLRRLGCLVLTLTLLLSCGCGSNVGSITGNVTYQGKPLPAGSITFAVEKAGTASGAIKSGAYSVSDVPLGLAKISIITPTAPSSPPPGTTAAGAAVETVTIPDKYRSSDMSGLELQIKGGNQVFDIKLD